MDIDSDEFEDDNLDLLILGFSQAPARSASNALSTANTQAMDPESQLRSAQGENAILRARLELIEHQKEADLKLLKQQFSSDLSDKMSKLQQYQEMMTRLEDEKKFLRSELDALSTKPKLNKKRRLDDDHATVENVLDARSPSRNTVSGTIVGDATQESRAPIPNMTSTPGTTPGSSGGGAPNIATTSVIPKPNATQTANQKQLFIDYIFNHVINGAPQTTLDLLSKIRSPISFKHETFYTDAKSGNIANSILVYLVQLNNEIRLDNLISAFIEILTIYVQKLYLEDYLVPIPLIMLLIHCSLSYRPSALHQDIIEQLLLFNSDFLKNYLHFLKPLQLGSAGTANGSGIGQDQSDKLQLQILEEFIVSFAMDIVELLSKLCFDKPELIQSFCKLLPKEIIKNCLSNVSGINYVFNAVEILGVSITGDPERVQGLSQESGQNLIQEQDEQEKNGNFFKDEDILLSLSKLLIEGIPLKSHFRVYGLNRLIGNNDDLKLLLKIIPDVEGNNSRRPSPILESDIKKVSVKNELNHEIHKLNLHLNILKFFEMFFMNKSDSIKDVKLETITELLRILVWVLLKQQEFLMRNPRSQTVYMRNLIVNTNVRLIHFIILRNGHVPQDLILQKLSNTVSYNFIILFLRISFSSDTNLGELALRFVEKLFSGENSTIDLDVPIFNKYVESTFQLQDNIVNGTPAELRIQSILNNNNGLEVSYEDDIIEMSRDLIELYTTLIELDSLYFAMNKLVQHNEIDELMVEYLDRD